MLSTLMWPQPPVFWSTIWICACWPFSAATFHDAQFSDLVVLPGRGVHDVAADHQVDRGRPEPDRMGRRCTGGTHRRPGNRCSRC